MTFLNKSLSTRILYGITMFECINGQKRLYMHHSFKISSVNPIVKERAEMSTSSLRRNRHLQQAEKNVFRLKNSMSSKFEEIMLQHLSRVTEVDASNFSEMSDMKTPTAKTTLKRRTLSFYRKSNKKRDMTKLTHDAVETLISLMDFIGRSNIITHEGLFRKTGNITRQKVVKKQIIEGAPIDYESISAHDCANVLKNFIGDLPEPLLTTRFRTVYDSLASNLTSSDRSRTNTLKALQLLMLMLPGDNYCLLRPLLTLLHRTAKVPENLMTADNLAIIFTPHFLCSKTMTGAELQTISKTCCKLVAFMVECGNSLFKVPVDLAEEVSNFWKEMEIPNNLYLNSVTKKNRPLKTLDDSVLLESPAKTPKKKSARRSLVHVIDLGMSPDKRRRSAIFSPRKRQSSETSETPEKRPLPDISVIQCGSIQAKSAPLSPISNQKTTSWPFPSSTMKDKPVAMVKPMTRSPISQFFRNVPQQLQKVMQTPRSRAPMLYDSPTVDDLSQEDIGKEIMC